MSWQVLAITGGILAGLIFFGVFFWAFSQQSRKRLIYRIEAQLMEHLRSIDVRSEAQSGKSTVIRTREDGYTTVLLRLLVTIHVWLRGIQSIEIWRLIRKDEEKTTTLDEITYVITLEPGMTLNRIPILTKIASAQTDDGKTELEWQGFEWGRLPLLVDRLKTDQYLNSRLFRYFDNNPTDNLRITAPSGQKICITMGYEPQRLPSREFLTCIEDLAMHVLNYIAERNITRAQEAGQLR